MDDDGLTRALLDSDERYRAVVAAMAEGAILQDASTRILTCNESAERLLGLTADQMMGRTSLDPRWRSIHEDGTPFPGEDHAVSVALRTGEPQRDVVMGVHKPDGTLTWLSVNALPLKRPGEGRPFAVVCTFGDITQRKLAEDALRRSEDRYRRIVETTLEGVWTIDLDGNTTFANQRMAELLGCTQAELATSNLWDFVAEAERARVRERMEARARGLSEQHDFPITRKDGTTVWTSMVTTPITHADGRKGALAMVRDVTSERLLQAELRESQAKLHLALSAGQLATWEWDFATARFGASPQLHELLGLPADAALATLGQVLGPVHPDDRPRLEGRVRAHITSGSTDRLNNEFRILRPDGRVRWLHTCHRVYRDAAAGSARILGTVADVTEQRGLVEALEQAHKLEGIGRLAGGVAHDFNNLLTAIMGSVSFAERLTGSQELRRELDTIRTAADRAAELTRQLLAFARKQLITLAALDLGVVIRELEPVLRRMLGEHIELTVALGAGLWTVRGDGSQLQQVLVNLAVNASEAMPGGGPLTIDTRNVVLDAVAASDYPDLSPGEYVVLRVTDRGSGMDAATRQHLFEPFFTTKRTGTGLGLASAYGIVKQLGGHIAVTSEPGVGSTFEVYLRRDGLAAAVAPPAPEARAVPGAQITVLVVEDDELLRSVVVRGLGSSGFEILVAGDGEQALAVAAQHAGPIHVLVSDVIMPRMSGKQLAERIMRLRPELTTLFVSGYTDQIIAREGELEPGQHFLAKPYTIDRLARTIAELAAAAPGGRAAVGSAHAPRDAGAQGNRD